MVPRAYLIHLHTGHCQLQNIYIFPPLSSLLLSNKYSSLLSRNGFPHCMLHFSHSFHSCYPLPRTSLHYTCINFYCPTCMSADLQYRLIPADTGWYQLIPADTTWYLLTLAFFFLGLPYCLSHPQPGSVACPILVTCDPYSPSNLWPYCDLSLWPAVVTLTHPSHVTRTPPSPVTLPHISATLPLPYLSHHSVW